MWLLVGLGNPGAGYAGNRHNIGFMAADVIALRYRCGPWKAKFQGRLAEGTVGDHRILLLKPDTYMNLSGQSVGEVVRFYKIPLDRVIVFHDDLDLPPGKVRVKTGGGSGGHNGLKSLDATLGPDYRRVRLGIGHPGAKELVHGYVLHDFAKEDTRWLIPLLDAAADNLPLLLDGKAPDYAQRLTLSPG